MVRIKDANGRAGPGHDVESMQARDYRSKARPMRKVWNDSFRLMLTLLDGEDVQLEAVLLEPVQVVAKPKVLVYSPKSVQRYSALHFQPGKSSCSQPAPTVLPTRVSFQVTAVVAVAVEIGDDEPVQEETEGEDKGEPKGPQE